MSIVKTSLPQADGSQHHEWGRFSQGCAYLPYLPELELLGFCALTLFYLLALALDSHSMHPTMRAQQITVPEEQIRHLTGTWIRKRNPISLY